MDCCDRLSGLSESETVRTTSPPGEPLVRAPAGKPRCPPAISRLRVEKVEGGLAVAGVVVAANCQIILPIFGFLFMLVGCVLTDSPSGLYRWLRGWLSMGEEGEAPRCPRSTEPASPARADAPCPPPLPFLVPSDSVVYPPFKEESKIIESIPNSVPRSDFDCGSTTCNYRVVECKLTTTDDICHSAPNPSVQTDNKNTDKQRPATVCIMMPDGKG
ncbi:unnamed protein product [Euphydryas editha]|uniref:Uncharacterized protein n=1 Tax=Euphydryas editha TaxID=104508 RepID=A0AAU9V579_EUPED|nr:unnamed protein product [Euphydryas editha]